MSEVRLARMHEVMAGYVERELVPGLLTLIERHGEVHADALGATVLGGREPIRHDTIFHCSDRTPLASYLCQSPKGG